MEGMAQSVSSKPEIFQYESNTANVMDIMVNSLYTDYKIFLRELISNSSDALNKVKLMSNKNPDILRQCNIFDIRISYNKKLNQIYVEDTGCGISKEDLISKIGTIATSGTKQFIELMKQQNQSDKSNQLIGQFGVGFYSVYLVADSVKIITKSIETNKIYEWESHNKISYTIKELDNEYIQEQIQVGNGLFNNFVRGTKIILGIKEDFRYLLDDEELIKIIQTHSGYIEHPIYFYKGTDEEKRIWEKVNFIPIWNRPKNLITHQDYINFYLEFDDNKEQNIKDAPIHYKHFSVEGAVDFTALLYIPYKAPFNLFEESIRGHTIKLYTKNVLITAEHKNLYPKWMDFIKGIIDTNDLQLNVSRQTIQETPKLKKIYNILVKKVIDMIFELMEDQDSTKYSHFYNHFSQSIKNGIHEEFSREARDESERNEGNKNGKRMLKLLRYHTSKGRFIGFDEYVESMGQDQKAIYYIAGDKKEVLETSPFLDRLKKFGYEVLYFTEPIDEYMKGFLTEYKNGEIVGIHDRNFERFKEPDLTDLSTKVFVDVSRDNLLVPIQTDDLEVSQGDELCAKLIDLYKGIGINFFEVKLDNKFESVPAIVVSRVHLSAQLEKLLCNNAMSKRKEQYQPVFDRKNLLVSISNGITKHLYQKLCVDKVPISDPKIIEIARFIHTTALIAGGYEINDANNFVRKAIEYMSLNI